MSDRERRREGPPPKSAGRAAERVLDPLALAAGLALALVLYGRGLLVGFVEPDLFALDTMLHTRLGPWLRGGALPGDFAPFSRELYWWWWGGVAQLDASAFHVLNAAIAVAGGWWLACAASRWAGAGAASLALLAWVVFPPLGTLLAATSGARELIAVACCAGALLAFAHGRWLVAAVGCALAALSGVEAWVLPLVLVAADVLERPADPVPRRLPRLLPSLAGGLIAAALVGAGRPAAPGVGLSVLESFARAWAPQGAWHGLGMVWRSTPWLVLLVAALAMAAVPRRRDGGGPAFRKLLPLGALLALLPLLPLAFSSEPLRAERFAVAALGVALAAGALVAVHPWMVRALVAVAALTSLGAHASIVAAGSASRQFTSIGELRQRSGAISPLMAALRPWCRDLAAVPRTFVAGVPPDSLFRIVLQRGAPVVCRNPAVSTRFLAEFTAADAPQPFGLLRFDPSGSRFGFERADARVRALVGEGLLLFARHEPAAACFEAAVAERPEDRELIYPLVIALASTQRFGDSRARWDAARRAGLAPGADSLAVRLLAGYGGGDADSVRRVTTGLAAEVVGDPAAAGPHLALGRHLLDMGRARSGTMEISVACGIGRRSQDVFWLARGYDAMGARLEAMEAYRAALAGGLDTVEYRVARIRLTQLLRELGTGAFATGPR